MQKFFWMLMLVSAVGIAAGCGSKPTQNPEPKMTDVVKDDVLTKIKEALKKAGVKNEPANIIEGDKEWVVIITPDGVGPNGEPPPGRPIPERVTVEKETFKVIRGQMPGGDRAGGNNKGRTIDG